MTFMDNSARAIFKDHDVDDTVEAYEIHRFDPKEARDRARRIQQRAIGRWIDRQRHQHAIIKEASNGAEN